MRAISNRLWAITLLLGWIFDFLFWKQQVGLNFVLYLTICLFGGLELLRAGGFRFARGSLFILVPFVFFGTATAVVQEPLTLFLAYAFSLLSLGLLANSYLGGRWYQYSLRDYLAKFLGLGGSILFLPLDDLKTTSQENARPRFLIVSVLRGLTIALPIVIFFALLLSSADAIFSQTLTDLFNAGKIIEYFARFLVILLAAWILAGTFLHAAARSRDETLFSDSSEARKKRLGLTETVIVLGSVAILFLIFVIIQFQYFFRRGDQHRSTRFHVLSIRAARFQRTYHDGFFQPRSYHEFERPHAPRQRNAAPPAHYDERRHRRGSDDHARLGLSTAHARH